MDEIEELGRLFRTSLSCYVSAIESVEEHALEGDSGEITEHRARLKLIRQSVSSRPNESALEESRSALDTELQAYSQKVNAHFRLKEREVREILAILADAASTMTKRSDRQAEQFRGLARDLETAAQSDSLAAIRKRLTEGVGRLKSCIDSMWEENRGSVSRLQRELRMFQRQVEEVQTLAATDVLTGLANRREAERLMAARIDAGKPLSIMLFDLDGFKLINDRHGHHVGDQVLKIFARKLAAQYRSGDVVCRWGGDEFLVILDSALRDAIGRAAAVASQMRGVYTIPGATGTVKASISASVGVAQHQPGESSEQLFARADAFLYQNKGVELVR